LPRDRPAKGGVHLPDGVGVEGVTRAVGIPAKVSIVVEINFGGDMATEVVKQAAERVHQRGERESNLILVKEVSASRGKAMRAEPISLSYEKGRVLHRRGLEGWLSTSAWPSSATKRAGTLGLKLWRWY
jgi:hypothetical protein